MCLRGEFFNERQTRTHERDLPLDEVAARESLRTVGEDRGRADVWLHKVWPRGECEEVAVQAEEAAERYGLATEYTEITECFLLIDWLAHNQLF